MSYAHDGLLIDAGWIDSETHYSAVVTTTLILITAAAGPSYRSYDID